MVPSNRVNPLENHRNFSLLYKSNWNNNIVTRASMYMQQKMVNYAFDLFNNMQKYTRKNLKKYAT